MGAQIGGNVFLTEGIRPGGYGFSPVSTRVILFPSNESFKDGLGLKLTPELFSRGASFTKKIEVIWHPSPGAKGAASLRGASSGTTVNSYLRPLGAKRQDSPDLGLFFLQTESAGGTLRKKKALGHP